MKTRTIPARDLKPGDRYFSGLQANPFNVTLPSAHAVHEVSAGHRLQSSEDAIGEPGYTVIWRDNAQLSTGMDVYHPGAMVEVIIEDARMSPDVLARLADLEWIDVMLWHYAGDLEHGSIDEVVKHRAYLDFLEARLEATRQPAGMVPHPLRAHAA